MSRFARIAASAAVIAAIVATTAASSPVGADAPTGSPESMTVGSAQPAAGDRTIPTFTDSFTFDGVTYPYTMVGTNPYTSTKTTTIPTEIIPLRFVFADGSVFDGTPRVPAVVASPLFQPAAFSSGVTQYGDAIQRASFWRSVSANGGGYHTLLQQPDVLPSVTIKVPAAHGQVRDTNGVRYGLIDIGWFYSIPQNLVGQLHLDPATLPIFLSDSIYLPDPHHCCVVGFHGTFSASSGPVNGGGNQKINTWVYSSWDHPDRFGDGTTLVGGDIDILSHEIAEWYADPFNNNVTPSWFSPLLPADGCSSVLEVGDPVERQYFAVNGYHLQDEAFKSWFAHDTPSEGINGQYTYLDKFAEPAPRC